MTVLYILDRGTIGGANKAFQWLVRCMQQNNVTPIVVTGKYDSFNQLLENNGIHTIAADHYSAIEPFSFKSKRWPLTLLKRVLRYYFKEFRALRKLQRDIDFSKINIIHTNSARNTIGCRLSKKYGIPHIVHIREFGDYDFNCIRLNPNYFKILNNGTNIFLSVSSAVLNYWNSKGIEVKKNRLMYDGAYCYDITVSSSNDKRQQLLKMVINGGVCETKGQHLAVEAIGLLPKNIKDNVTLDIVGWNGEPYLTRLKSCAKIGGYEKQIRILGTRDDVHQRMGEYQIGLMCSKSEGFGLVTAEYMHGQLGVIASDSGACPELIDDGRTGLLFKSGDSKDLARCIELLYNDRDLLVRLSENAREEALNRFAAEINANNIYKIYQEILNKK